MSGKCKYSYVGGSMIIGISILTMFYFSAYKKTPGMAMKIPFHHVGMSKVIQTYLSLISKGIFDFATSLIV